MIDFEPTEEQALIIETVRQFAENEIRPRGRETRRSRHAAGGRARPQAHELGLVANGLPEAYGGGGERERDHRRPDRRGARAGAICRSRSPSSRRRCSALPVADFGTRRAAQARSCPRFCGRDFVPGALAIVEPRFDSDAFRPADDAPSATATNTSWTATSARCPGSTAATTCSSSPPKSDGRRPSSCRATRGTHDRRPSRTWASTRSRRSS